LNTSFITSAHTALVSHSPIATLHSIAPNIIKAYTLDLTAFSVQQRIMANKKLQGGLELVIFKMWPIQVKEKFHKR